MLTAADKKYQEGARLRTVEINRYDEEILQRMKGGNPIAGPDHRPFSGFSDELVYGRDIRGNLIHISQAVRGLACGCRCPACEGVLIANKGDIRIHHFSHQSAGCGGGPETNAHIWAKEVLEREKWLMVPAVSAQHDNRIETHTPAQIYRFAQVRLEKRLGRIVPDVILETKNGTQLIVEVWVTHMSEPEKLETLVRDNLSAIEIDLRHLRKSQDRSEVEDALLQSARRAWLHNSKQVEHDDRLRQKIEEEARLLAQREAEAAEHAAKLKNAAAERDRKREERTYRQLVQASRATRPTTAKQNEFITKVFSQIDGLEPIAMRSVGFRYADAMWQATILNRYLTYPEIAEFDEDLPISLDDALSIVRNQLAPVFQNEISPAHEARFRSDFPEMRLPRQAVSQFLQYLDYRGYLSSWGDDNFIIDEAYQQKVMENGRRQRIFEERMARLKAALDRLFEKVPANERQPFDFGAWASREHQSSGRSAESICMNVDGQLESMLGELKQIEIMLEGGMVVENLLGLPLDAVAKRLSDEKREKALEAASSRRLSLRLAAEYAFGDGAAAWLSGPSQFDPDMSRADLAGIDSMSFQRARTELEREIIARKVRDEARTKLREMAIKVYRDDETDLFLTSTQPGLGMSPTEFCVDERTLRICLNLLSGGKKRGR